MIRLSAKYALNKPIPNKLTNIAAHTKAGIVLRQAELAENKLEQALYGLNLTDMSPARGKAKIRPVNEERSATRSVSIKGFISFGINEISGLMNLDKKRRPC